MRSFLQRKYNNSICSINCENDSFEFSEFRKKEDKFDIFYNKKVNFENEIDKIEEWNDCFRPSFMKFSKEKKFYGKKTIVMPRDKDVFVTILLIPKNIYSQVNKQSIGLELNRKFPRFLMNFYWQSIPCFPDETNRHFVIFGMRKEFPENLLNVFFDAKISIMSFLPSIFLKTLAISSVAHKDFLPAMFLDVQNKIAQASYISSENIFWMRSIIDSTIHKIEEVPTFCKKLAENLAIAQIEAQIELPKIKGVFFNDFEMKNEDFKRHISDVFSVPVINLQSILPKNANETSLETFSILKNLEIGFPSILNFAKISHSKYIRTNFEKYGTFIMSSICIIFCIISLIVKNKKDFEEKKAILSSENLSHLKKQISSLNKTKDDIQCVNFNEKLIISLENAKFQWTNLFSNLEICLKNIDSIYIDTFVTTHKKEKKENNISKISHGIDFFGAVNLDSVNKTSVSYKTEHIFENLSKCKLIKHMNIIHTKINEHRNENEFGFSIILDPESYL